MNKNLQCYLYNQNYEIITQKCIEWIKGWFDVNGPQSPAVIGISGGKDSTIVAKLCVEALGKDRVFGVLMPNGTQADIDVSKKVVQWLGINYKEINIKDAYDAITNDISNSGIELKEQCRINLAPRLRMTTLYAVSQCMNGRVSNNCNASENYVGYSTIFGDAAGDFSPLANLTVTEIKEIGKVLNVPSEFIEKAPSDGLTNRTDEDNFGFTYEQLDTLILTGICEDEVVKELIEKRHKANLFKLKSMPEFKVEG